MPRVSASKNPAPPPQPSPPEPIRIRGARQNNLRSLDLDLPGGKLIVLTGPSGSGKSSLAFDTLYAEGQRRYIETFSPYTRQFFERMDKPLVDEISGIPPSIALEQNNSVRNSRSTVGTLTELADYLKLLFPALARGFCPSCGREVRPETAASILSHLAAHLRDRPLLLAFRIPAPAKTDPAEFFSFLQSQGYLRVWLGGRLLRADEPPPAGLRLPPEVTVVQDRFGPLSSQHPETARLAESVETALRLGAGRLVFIEPETGAEHPFSRGWHCAHCDLPLRPPTPSLFSFNHPLGACPECKGFGRLLGLDLGKVIPDPSLSLEQGAIRAFTGAQYQECQRDLLRAARQAGIPTRTPFNRLSEADQRWVIEGDPAGKTLTPDELWEAGLWYGVEGFFKWLESKSYKMHVRVFLSRYRGARVCPKCGGGRLQPEALNYRLPLGGSALTLPEINRLTVTELIPLFEDLHAAHTKNPAAALLLAQILSRLRCIEAVGLGYLTPARTARTLSGGELQRVNLAACIGAGLVNTLFVLDEPTIGLHPEDTARLVRVLEALRDRGNTLVVVEHEEAVMRAADRIVDIGPGRGSAGGRVVFYGDHAKLRELPAGRSLTADYLNGHLAIPAPARVREPSGWLHLRGASAHNIRNADFSFPLGCFTCVTGVSGSGKSTLVHTLLYNALQRLRGAAPDDEDPGQVTAIEGAGRVGQILLVDQSPLTKTPRSTPALYIGAFDGIRRLFAALPEARSAGLTPGHFSFNSGPGRCERCGGAGFEKVEMQFLSDIHVRCPECEGRRFKPELLRVKLDGLSIHDVLELTVSEAVTFFRRRGLDSQITDPLSLLEQTGLGYLRLGQPLNTLSGGESQRLKLVGHLASRAARTPASASGKTDLLLLDEPTTGLHFDDITLLLKVFHRLADEGHTLVVIEHNLDVIKNADHILDLGPGPGEQGGRLVAAGTPAEIAAHPDSVTGRHLAPLLGLKPRRPAVRPAKPAPLTDGLHPPPGKIAIRGAREHNLKNISADIPRDSFVVITGLSGSGKSSLAFDLLFAEGQRRFLDSMSAYARQFVGQLEKPDVDWIGGLPPTVAIEQRVTRGGGKSTVATVTEIYHFLRLLFAKLGVQHCPDCDLPVGQTTRAAIVRRLLDAARSGAVRVLAPLVRGRKGFHNETAAWAAQQGFTELLVDGQLIKTSAFRPLDRFREHTIDAVVLTVPRGADQFPRELENLLDRALEIGKGVIRLLDHRRRLTVLSTAMTCPGCGRSFEPPDPRLFSFNSPHGWCPACRGYGALWTGSGADSAGRRDDTESLLEAELREERLREGADPSEFIICPSCHGARLNPVARAVRLQGVAIHELTAQPAARAAETLSRLRFEGAELEIAAEPLRETASRLEFLRQAGLGYLALNRSAQTLSGGESQRIRLAAQLGSNLSGVLYILDEPTIGLHPRDNARLLDMLTALRARGNSLIVVEHDEETIRRADHILDLGPGAGRQGGQIVAQGPPGAILRDPASPTGRALSQSATHPIRGARRQPGHAGWIELRGARANNLKNLDIRIPKACLTVITGVSGSGKSSLMRGVLLPAASEALARPRAAAARRKSPAAAPRLWDSITGLDGLDGVAEVDQSPIGKTPRSTPATYVGFFDEIRALFARLPAARMRGLTASDFSFNTGRGRCEACGGHGVIRVEMNFLPPSHVPCEDCGGQRFNPRLLEITLDGRHIAAVMAMTVDEAADFFKAHPKIAHPLGLLAETGLGYLQLGQPSPTLSGGEAQRIKLVTELARRGPASARPSRAGRASAPRGRLLLLEEPTIGLHLADVGKLISLLHRLVDGGDTVVVIEHNTALMAEADYILDIGPEPGGDGGRLVASGPPEEIVRCKDSRTAPFLAPLLSPPPATPRRRRAR